MTARYGGRRSERRGAVRTCEKIIAVTMQSGRTGEELVVVSAIRAWTCAACGAEGDLLKMEDAGPMCLTCADLDHLVYLPRGDAALTRRARKHSRLSAVVVRFSRSRKRYERQGVLVEAAALDRAEAECLSDEDVRAARRERARVERQRADARLQAAMAAEIKRLFPGCPDDRASAVAAHTAVRGSGRVGRSAAGRALDPGALALAVAASVRHTDTQYDDLLMGGTDRAEARDLVRVQVDEILERWQRGRPGAD
jgi:hypothetical protein